MIPECKLTDGLERNRIDVLIERERDY
jgi:hypothetical protein